MSVMLNAPLDSLKTTSAVAVLHFWRSILALAHREESLRVLVQPNLVALLLYDFHLKFDSIKQPVRIEHKYGSYANSV